jgi:hypothetical protein
VLPDGKIEDVVKNTFFHEKTTAPSFANPVAFGGRHDETEKERRGKKGRGGVRE